ncbi:MAG: type VI secretion system baseplate subunit TssE [Betaproteobacteria bacterium]|nr:type VI secretion system baseplate subunit TssE [Betaproteobacteria bacterium]
MAELLPQDRLQPALLDRLIDDEPEKKTEPPERRVLTLSRLRESALRDLNWLFNATQMATAEALEDHPYVAGSVVNYGLPAFSGTTASGIDVRAMESALRQAILDFEPRLLAHSVRVKARLIEREENTHNRLSFDIECKLWAQPAPIALLLHSDVDLESGQTTVAETGRR